MTPSSTSPRVPSFWRRFWPPLLLGLLGVLALALQISRQFGAMPRPDALAGWPLPALLVLAMASPIILLLVGSGLGAGLAHRVGLHSWAAGTGPAPAASALRLAVMAGLALALLLFVVDWLLEPWLGLEGQLLSIRATGSGAQLLVGLLYGGLTEEVIMRWGLFSLVVWVLRRATRSRRPGPDASGPGAGVLWSANLIAAVLFAAGHVPALLAALEPSTLLLVRTLVLNTVAGLLYGWLFWRHRLESAMVAHAATHVGFWLLAALAL